MLFQGTYDVYRSMLEIPNSLCLFFSRCAWSDRDDTIQSAMSPAVTLPGPGRELTAAFEKNLQNFWGFMFVNYDNGCCSSQKCSQSHCCVHNANVHNHIVVFTITWFTINKSTWKSFLFSLHGFVNSPQVGVKPCNVRCIHRPRCPVAYSQPKQCRCY